MQRCLIFDADDTLWENNVYFDHAIEEFLELVRPFAPEAVAVRELLRQVELECIPTGGYGTRNFINALKETCRRVSKTVDGTAYLESIERIGERLLNHPIDLRPGVQSTLPLLQEQNLLMVFSKGDLQEQTGKLERSGLRDFFERVVIVQEKDTGAYHSLVRELELRPETTFMIGNSPRSDVLPALAAGLWAVFLPHPNTWDFEDHPVVPHPRLLHAQSFSDLPALLVRPQPDAVEPAQGGSSL